MSFLERKKVTVSDLSDELSFLGKTFSITVPILIPDSSQKSLPADVAGIKWTSAFKFKWDKQYLSKVVIRASWSSTATDNVVKIAVRDEQSGNDVVSLSGNSGTDAVAEQTDLTNVSDGYLATVYAEVTTPSATAGATFDIDYVAIELVYTYT